MPEQPVILALLLLGFAVGVAAWLWRAPAGVFTGGRVHLPQKLRIRPVTRSRVPRDATIPVAYLSQRLNDLGFRPYEPVLALPDFQRWGRRLVALAYVHPDERAVFLMAVASSWMGRSELMLHLITPLTGERRVETTTLSTLRRLGPPEKTTLNVVDEVERVEEVWSAHRMSLTNFERREREALRSVEELVRATYDGWLAAGVTAGRLALDPSTRMYRMISA
ncbi:MAG: hypothetical protein ACFB9M_04975 [Myxococcota bacterium]